MSFLNSVIKVFVGDKSQQDVKALSPMVDKIKDAEKQIQNLTHDELRYKTQEFKNKLADAGIQINYE